MGIFNKKRSVMQTTMLQEMGVYCDFKKKNTNPQICCNPKTEIYHNLLTFYDYIQNISEFKYNNLPNGYTSEEIERMLYFNNSLVSFNLGLEWYTLPFVNKETTINARGLVTECTPIPYAYDDNSKRFKNDITLKTYVGDPQRNGVILHDLPPYIANGHGISRAFLNEPLINDEARVLSKIGINLDTATKKFTVRVRDQNQAQVMQELMLEYFNNDLPFNIVVGDDDITELTDYPEFESEALFNTLKNYDALRCAVSGISAKGFGSEKKERLITGELSGQEEERELIRQLRLACRQQWAEQCNQLFGTNITVELRVDPQTNTTDFDAHGNTQEDFENQGGDNV